MTNLRFGGRNVRFEQPPLDVFFGRTAAMLAVRQKIEMLLRTTIPVLIQGESGTGKELCAQLIHGSSEKIAGDLVKVSCPAIPSGLIETELFGYEKGSFTGAQSTRRGRLEQSNGGTLFLDEVGSLDLGVQAKLLHVLQDGSFLRVGGHETRRIRARIIAVANRDLQEQVTDGSFRLDLFYRINAVTITMPPLRSRAEDIPRLIDYFLEVNGRVFQTTPPPLSRGVMRLLESYDWPGNIRQLENLVRTYVLMGSEEAIVAELGEGRRSEPTSVVSALDLTEPISLKQITKQATQDLERQIILKVLRANNWNRQRTARFLKISYRSLLYKLNEVSSTGPEDLHRLRGRAATAAPAGSAAMARTGLIQ